MITIYNMICDSKEDQIKTAKRLRKEIEVIREMSLEEQRKFFINFYQSKDLGSSFCDPHFWENEQDGGLYNAIEFAPDEVEEYFAAIAEEQITYLDSIIQD